MAKGLLRCRPDNKATEVNGKLFFNNSTDHPTASKASMRRAALRFAETDGFTDNCLYYDGHLIDGRWQFSPIGEGQHF